MRAGTRVEDPAVFVFGLRETTLVAARNVVVPIHLLDVHRVAQPLHRGDLFGSRRRTELEFHARQYREHGRRVPVSS